MIRQPNRFSPFFNSVAIVSLILLFIINVTSVGGYAVFSLHPEMLERWPWTQEIFQMSYAFFARAQIVVATVSLVAILISHAGIRWLPAAVAIGVVSFLSELAGTTYGIPFGKYEYSVLLGPKIFNRVPYLIPPSWFFMSVAAYALSERALGKRAMGVTRVIAGSILLLAWDLTLDPAMSHLSPFWIWSENGIYFGTPFKNLLGWFATGVVNMLILEWMAKSWLHRVSLSYYFIFYLANLILPLGLVVCAGLWEPVVISAVVYSTYFLISYLRTVNPRVLEQV
jgi:uncharacterized membrane protein